MSQADSPKSYIPTGTTPQLVIQSLNDYLGIEISIPGAWSPTIFYSDLKTYPATSKKVLADLVRKANEMEAKGSNFSYLSFFEESRGKPRPEMNEKKKEIWKVFEQGSIMLYFEPVFLRFLTAPDLSKEDEIILQYLKVLSQIPVVRWNEVVKGIGACCHQFFEKEPELYARLVFTQKSSDPESMTDDELLAAIGSKLSPIRYRGQICLDDSRSTLIKRYRETIS